MKPRLEAPQVITFLGVTIWTLFYQALAKIQNSTILRKIRNRVSAWGFLLNGPLHIREGYKKANGKPFSIHVPEARYVCIPPGKYQREVNQMKSDELSMYAASRQMFMPQYSMHRFNWLDQRGKHDIGFTKLLAGISTVQLPGLIPTLLNTISHEMKTQVASNSRLIGNVQHTAVYPMILRIVAKLNSIIFFGKEATDDEVFFEAAVRFVEDVFLTAEILRILPQWLVPVVGGLVSRNKNRQRMLFRVLLTRVEQRLEASSMASGTGNKTDLPNDCLQWTINNSPKKNPWTAERIVHETMALWFGALHAISMSLTYVTLDLCVHSEYVEILRKELDSPAYTTFLETSQGLPLLDSFIKESARVTPFEVVSSRRRALKDLVLSDGTRINKGDWTVSPQEAMGYDEKIYQNPMDFDGFRFVKSNLAKSNNTNNEEASSFVDTSDTWHFFGHGKVTCPGRFYSSTLMKLVAVHILSTYDMEIVDKAAPRSKMWRTTNNPSKDVRVIFRPKA